MVYYKLLVYELGLLGCDTICQYAVWCWDNNSVLCFPAQAIFSIVIVVKLTHMPPHLHGTNVQCLTVNNMD